MMLMMSLKRIKSLMMLMRGFTREDASADFQFFEFASDHPNGVEFVHAFFEGQEDKSFYRNFLDSSISKIQKLRIYTCGSKKGVYEIFERIKAGYSLDMGLTLYFVDKDLSDILNEDWEVAPNIYVTDYYSIENYLVNEDMFARVWSELFHFKCGSIEFSNVHREKFIQELDSFHQFVRPLIAWTIFLRRQGRKPNVNNIKFSRFFDFDDQLVLRKSAEFASLGDFGLLSKVCGEQVSDEQLAQVRNIEKEISACGPKTYIRGKLEMYFFLKFIDKLIELLNLHISNDGGKVSLIVPLSEDNAITVLGPRLPIPQSLKQFLDSNLMNSVMQAD